jgi:hypothetical protein
MKTIYSLKEFHEKAVEISGKTPDLIWVRVQYGLFGKYEFSCYADQYSIYSGETMEESLRKFQDAVNPQPSVKQNIDVEIEVEQETETI